ncbi:phosphate ABC transporter permease subunit PstC [Deferrisoma camini]|uniref:phosphate ABC transporter permease subunit PstC n=1 Tax=Deferrisoma camini TaxID=1035120 RepID=UPI0004A252D7|nr:phosphate ABC transporter permease subunit PstC [Deferrisoma camini]
MRDSMTVTRRRFRAGERLMEGVLALCGYTSVLVLAGIFVLLLWQGARAFREVPIWEFLTTARWDPTSPEGARYGIGSMVASTFLVTLGAMAFTVPLGIGVAAYLSEFAPARVREVLKPAVEMLAAIPSVVVGFIGIVVVGPAIARLFGLPNGLTALNGAVLLTVMALPTAVSLSEDALRAVPRDHRLASLALGANPWETLVKVTLSAAAPGILAAMMLAMGRAIGETMTVLMATGNAPAFPSGLLSPVRTMTATIAIELGEVPHGTAHYFALFAVGFALFVISFAVNWVADGFIRRGRRAQ